MQGNTKCSSKIKSYIESSAEDKRSQPVMCSTNKTGLEHSITEQWEETVRDKMTDG